MQRRAEGGATLAPGSNHLLLSRLTSLGQERNVLEAGRLGGRTRAEFTPRLSLWAGRTRPPGAICPLVDLRERIDARRGAP